MEQKMKSKCLLCGQEASLKRTDMKGYKEPDVFSIYACPYCNTNFSVPRSSDVYPIYQLIYRNAANLPGYDTYWRFYQEIKKEKKPLRYLASRNKTYWSVCYALRKMVSSVKKSPVVFEIGSGLGYLTYALRQAGYNATGLDISEEAVKRAKSDFGDNYICADIIRYSREHVKEVDIVVLTEVIEHVEDPIAFLKSLLLLLKDNGSIILTTPNKSYASSSLIWDTDRPPVHYWWFSEDSIIFMAKALGLSVEFVDFSNCYIERMNPSTPSSSDIENKHIFLADGRPVEYADRIPQYGIFPRWLKRTELYKAFSYNIYPFLLVLFRRKTSRCGTMCAVLTKNIPDRVSVSG